MAALLVMLAFPDGLAHGYRFFGDSFGANTQTALLWSRQHWPLGQTLSWVVSGDPGWTAGWDTEYGRVPAPFTDETEVLPLVAQALAAWSGIEGADIRWDVAGMDAGVEAGPDGRMSVTVSADTEIGTHAAFWTLLGTTDEGSSLTECDVVMAPWGVDARSPDFPSGTVSTLFHEFGHCLGLAHAAAAPHTLDADNRSGELSLWGPSPAMSYGPFRYFSDRIDHHPDDRIGASLLRPAASWLPTRGTISGRIAVGGQKGSYLSVWAIRLSGPFAEAGVGKFTDREGDFELEGLAPGDYLIRAGPPLVPHAHGFSSEATLDVNDGFALDLLTVRPGLVTEGGALDLLGPRGGIASEASRSRSTSCPGLDIQALPPVRNGESRLSTSVTVELTGNATRTAMHLLGPYFTTQWHGRPNSQGSATRIREWQAEREGNLVRHTFDVEWSSEGTPGPSDLRLGFRGGLCEGGTLELVCSLGACELIPG